MPERTELKFDDFVIEAQEGEPWSLQIACADSAGCTDTQVTGAVTFLFDREGKADNLIGRLAQRDLEILRDTLMIHGLH